MITEKVNGAVVKALLKLRPDDIPEHLMQKDPVRSPKDFDPNIYFTVLTHLVMKQGYTLDYVYHWDSIGGYPCLYARAADEKPLESDVECELWEKKNFLFSFLVADGTPDSFFQLAVFKRLAGQFYLFWHALYNDIKIVTSSDEMEAIITEVNGEHFGAMFTDEQIASMRAIDLEPTVEMSENVVEVCYCLFSKWGGLARVKESFQRSQPYLRVSIALVAEVEYNCGVRF